jgi:hypothetical protein
MSILIKESTIIPDEGRRMNRVDVAIVIEVEEMLEGRHCSRCDATRFSVFTGSGCQTWQSRDPEPE